MKPQIERYYFILFSNFFGEEWPPVRTVHVINVLWTKIEERVSETISFINGFIYEVLLLYAILQNVKERSMKFHAARLIEQQQETLLTGDKQRWDSNIDQRVTAAADNGNGNNNNKASATEHDIHARDTQRAQRAAILLPSFRSPRLCNYDFIFMDINYTGCLAVSLYGILIQGCRHNGNPHHGQHRCSPAQWREEKKEETCARQGWRRGGRGGGGRGKRKSYSRETATLASCYLYAPAFILLLPLHSHFLAFRADDQSA